MPDESKTGMISHSRECEVVLNDVYREIVGVAYRWTSPPLWFGAHRLAATYPGSVGRAIIGQFLLAYMVLGDLRRRSVGAVPHR